MLNDDFNTRFERLRTDVRYSSLFLVENAGIGYPVMGIDDGYLTLLDPRDFSIFQLERQAFARLSFRFYQVTDQAAGGAKV